MWLTIENIECLAAVNNTGSLNAAAEKLGKAKSAVSYSLKNLEHQLGFPILDRSHYRLKLTNKAQDFLYQAQGLLREKNKLLELAHQIAAGVESRLALSSTALFPSDKLNVILRKILSQFPKTELIYHREILSGEKMLSQNIVDIGIFEHLTNKEQFDYKVIDQVQMPLVIACDHPIFAASKLDSETLLKYPQIVQRSTLSDQQLNKGIIEQSRKWTVTDMASKKELIISGLGWGRIPMHLIKKEIEQNKLIILEQISPTEQVDIYICKHRNKEMGAVASFLWDAFA